jgi:prenyltransferase beta subunit
MAAAARRWLLTSGIRCDSGPPFERGAVHRAYDAERRMLLPLYPEITGYAVQFHVRWCAGKRNGPDMAAACASGEWLMRVQADERTTTPGAFPLSAAGGSAHGGFFTFDSAVIGHALLDLCEATGDERYFAAAERAARWLLRQQRPDGGFRACMGGGEPVSWASDGNCLHGKVAVFLGRLWQKTGEDGYRRSARALLDWLAPLQQDDGRIVTSRSAPYAFIHAHCYALEGMLAGALYLGESSFLERVASGADFLAAVQRHDGGLPRHVGRAAAAYLRECGARLPRLRALLAPADVGATAQAVRLWTWLRALAVRDHSSHVARGLGWLARHQLRSGGVVVQGGFPAAIDPLKPWQRREMRLYPWVAMFAADATRLQSRVNVAEDLY